LGVQFISVYAFSIDNFSRSLEEVEGLMGLAEAKYNELAKVSYCIPRCAHACALEDDEAAAVSICALLLSR
jgi:undecaprenyl diphosphate synthase